MKYLLSILLVITTNVYGQTKDTIWRDFDTVKVIMQVSDTGYLYNNARDTKIYWHIGYKVIGDYDTYYLDILKQPLRKSIIVWLDQNL